MWVWSIIIITITIVSIIITIIMASMSIVSIIITIIMAIFKKSG